MEFVKGQPPKSVLNIGEPILALLDTYKKVLDDLGFGEVRMNMHPTIEGGKPYFACRSNDNNTSRLTIMLEESGIFSVGATRGYNPQNSVTFKDEYRDAKIIKGFFAEPQIIDRSYYN